MKYSAKRALAHVTGPTCITHAKQPVGTVLKFKEVIQGEYILDGVVIPNDVIIAVDEEGRFVRIPVIEFMHMSSKETPLYMAEADNDEVRLPHSIEILGSKDRLDFNGDIQFPNESYELYSEFMKCDGIMSHAELIAGGLKGDNEFPPLQNYIVDCYY